MAIKNNGLMALFAEVGTGKTLTALMIFNELRKTEPTLKMLVICPLSLIYGAWTREIEKFTSYNWCDLHDKKKIKRRAAPVDIYLMNFEHVISEVRYAELKEMLKSTGPWMCVIDESSKMKNYKAITTDRILKLRNLFKYRIPMSGSPAPNIEWEYWAQMLFVSEKILGDNFYKFKNTHFVLQRGDQVMSGQVMNKLMIHKMFSQGFKYEITPYKREEMFQRMKPWCFWIAAKDCIDLPEEADEYRVVNMVPDQAKIYKQMKEAYIAELKPEGTFAIANVVLTKLLRLRQITSGFVRNDYNQDVSISDNNPKINALLDIVEECGNEQMIIFCQFHWEIDKITALLKEIAGVSELHGRILNSQRTEMLDNFLNGKNRFLVANDASAAHGLTLTNCHLMVFFSLDYSMEGYSQARGRIYRKGQKNNCLYFHILAKGTIDEDVLGIVQKKETAQDFARRFLQNG
jgi:SNF2 family DNA or RNA helicase